MSNFDHTPTLSEILSAQAVAAKIISTFPTREPRSAKVRKHSSDNFCTLDEIANELGVTRERCRQIQNTAIEKLKHQLRNHDSTDYL